MPAKRQILEHLKRDELGRAAQDLDVHVTDRRARTALIDALDQAGHVTAASLLEPLPRDRLKELCRALDLDDSGRAKAELIARLTQNPGRTPARKPAPAAPEPAAPAATLTLPELERHLWGAADILRGSIDSSDYKHYIFGLLFFKRLCDVWHDEYRALLSEYDGDHETAVDPDEHRFHIPANCFWDDVRKQAHNIGETLNLAFRAIEDANPRLQGVFQDVDFANKERFPDALLEALLQHFEKYRMGRADVDSRMLGDAYEYLIAKFADDAGKKGTRRFGGEITGNFAVYAGLCGSTPDYWSFAVRAGLCGSTRRFGGGGQGRREESRRGAKRSRRPPSRRSKTALAERSVAGAAARSGAPAERRRSPKSTVVDRRSRSVRYPRHRSARSRGVVSAGITGSRGSRRAFVQETIWTNILL